MNSHVLCLDTLLMFIGQMVERVNSEVNGTQDLIKKAKHHTKIYIVL